MQGTWSSGREIWATRLWKAALGGTFSLFWICLRIPFKKSNPQKAVLLVGFTSKKHPFGGAARWLSIFGLTIVGAFRDYLVFWGCLTIVVCLEWVKGWVKQLIFPLIFYDFLWGGVVSQFITVLFV